MQGFAELNSDAMPNAAQWKSIQEHLRTVFTKVTPPVNILIGPASTKQEDVKTLPDAMGKYLRALPQNEKAWPFAAKIFC